MTFTPPHLIHKYSLKFQVVFFLSVQGAHNYCMRDGKPRGLWPAKPNRKPANQCVVGGVKYLNFPGKQLLFCTNSCCFAQTAVVFMKTAVVFLKTAIVFRRNICCKQLLFHLNFCWGSLSWTMLHTFVTNFAQGSFHKISWHCTFKKKNKSIVTLILTDSR